MLYSNQNLFAILFVICSSGILISMADAEIKLYDYNYRGKVESIRLMLEYKNIKYDLKYIEPETFTKDESKLLNAKF